MTFQNLIQGSASYFLALSYKNGQQCIYFHIPLGPFTSISHFPMKRLELPTVQDLHNMLVIYGSFDINYEQKLVHVLGPMEVMKM